MTEKPLWALGLMSGTSADGIDGAVIQTDGKVITVFGSTHYIPYPDSLKKQIMASYGRRLTDETRAIAQAITELHANLVFELIEKAGMKPNEIDLIGFHGQTIFHQPPTQETFGETYQIGDGTLLASLTGIPVVEQFRINDVAHGGQGAPLVPVFHQALAKNLPKPMAIINIGGVANLTWIGEREDDLLGFDTGPGNGLIDDWVGSQTGLPYDDGGKIATLGKVNEDLLVGWLNHPYFSQKPPKSIDRQAFQACLEDVKALSFEDGIATLTALTAASMRKSLVHLPQKPDLWIVAGGGVHNQTLMEMMNENLGVPLKKASDLGWNNDALEAQAFAFLAVRSLRNLPLTYPGTTDAPYPLTGGKLCKPV